MNIAKTYNTIANRLLERSFTVDVAKTLDDPTRTDDDPHFDLFAFTLANISVADAEPPRYSVTGSIHIPIWDFKFDFYFILWVPFPVSLENEKATEQFLKDQIYLLTRNWILEHPQVQAKKQRARDAMGL